jgi:MFS transporter, DHA3 family, multidrug efflux protein
MKTFHRLLLVSLVAGTTNNFIWFALTYFAYLETKSVISTSLVAGVWLVATALSGFWLGSIVDHHKKKHAMLGSSIVSLITFTLGFLLYSVSGPSAFTSVASPVLWLFILILLAGVIAGSIYQIAVPTLVAVLVPEDQHDKANGLYGTVTGISFAITSVASGFTLAYGGMYTVLLVSLLFTLIAIALLMVTPIPEKKLIHTTDDKHKKVDIKGTIKAVRAVPGLFALIFFTTFNNFLGGVFMALMDAYGLTLVSVQIWGLLWGFLSFGFIIGGLVIAKRGLGKNPVNTLFIINMILWTVCIFFTIQPSIILLTIGAFIWLCLVPFLEAIEQTIMQKVVSPERLGRVFGFAHSVEQSASPITAFFIGPIAQFGFIPFMTTGAGVDLIGDWFGVGPGRGIALVFTTAGIIGLIITIIASRSKYARLLSKRYLDK